MFFNSLRSALISSASFEISRYLGSAELGAHTLASSDESHFDLNYIDRFNLLASYPIEATLQWNGKLKFVFILCSHRSKPLFIGLVFLHDQR